MFDLALWSAPGFKCTHPLFTPLLNFAVKKLKQVKLSLEFDIALSTFKFDTYSILIYEYDHHHEYQQKAKNKNERTTTCEVDMSEVFKQLRAVNRIQTWTNALQLRSTLVPETKFIVSYFLSSINIKNCE